MNYQLAHNSHEGIKRSHNEDTYGIDNEHHVFLVADGMGGHDHGEIASALARDYIIAGIVKGKSFSESIQEANDAIIACSLEKESQLPMGTTVALLQFDNQHCHCAWIGDSRIYRLRSGKLTAISSDHSYVQELVDQQLITSEQARSHPHRNVVTQALGVTDNSEMKIAEITDSLQSGDKFLVCSDGLTEEVEDHDIEHILCQNLSPKELCDQLIIKALENGGSDNITAIVVSLD
ncbi:PP2C family protein-serine/threonine phosphatase [Marinicella gelatinilytica]|uniref:PP2C family protein-serine/threonine phosphatase n=1 Tax=Marinicella gelatinilytica TaxID=2996017 RepID=UPI002260C796|nr:protein phosphatase 2C domain-containing protein [Marinicella gelatinilytica]MCX7543915.1 protein phosphatase 2C domain-containing protein [Marinicella gelatinilytica]